jgi:hypothetical protein
MHYAEREGHGMSVVSEWILEVHRAIWYPVLYAMGLEGQSVELMDRRFRYTRAFTSNSESHARAPGAPEKEGGMTEFG